MSDLKALAEEAKKKGNEALAKSDFDAAIAHYTEALKHDPSNHILFSNRSAAYCTKGDYTKALEDADRTISLQPNWGKGHGRRAAALHGKGDLDGALASYGEGLKHDPNNEQLKKGLSEVQTALRVAANPLVKLFADPQLLTKILAHPRLKAYAAQPDYLRMLSDLQKNPNQLEKYLEDPRMMQTLTALMGIGESDDVEPMDTTGTANGHTTSASAEELRARQERAEKERVEKERAEKERAEKERAEKERAELPPNKRDALAAKELGNAAYKKREFEAAVQHYTRAVELDNADISFVLNRAACYLEMDEFEKAVEDCLGAVETGRQHRADFKLIARAYARVATARARQQRWTDAVTYYQKSLTEDRQPEVLEALRKAERELKLQQEREYVDPTKSEAARQLGNDAFKKQQYPEAVKHYDEAIRRNPDDHTLYSNRAAAYTKLRAYPQALADCEECLRRKPDFVKAYIRKGFVHYCMKEYNKALQIYDKGLELDPNNDELKQNIAQVVQRVNESPDPETQRRAMADPEIQAMLQDPVMMSVLRHMQEDPASMQDYLKDAKIRSNLEKLMASGIIRTGSRAQQPAGAAGKKGGRAAAMDEDD